MKTTVLIIDDSAVELEWATQALYPYGIDVLCYGQSIGVRTFVTQHMPDLILLDIHMPALGGDRLCELLKSCAKTKSVPILLYSSIGEGELAELAHQAGAQGYVCKNHDAVKLALAITKLTRHAAAS